MLNYDIDFDNRQVLQEKILFINALEFGALAWRGYQLKSRGAVIVQRLKERQDAFEQSIEIEVDYLSKPEAVQNYSEAIGLFDLMDDYHPNNEIVVAFTNRDDSVIESYRLTLIFPPSQCYILLQERLLQT